ncbi:hypothetical protein EDC04DRAFT_2519561, partial [Pisolithus marmoratus]
FISSADKLSGPITSICHPGQPIKHIPWTAFTLKQTDWECANDTQAIIADANAIQHLFSCDNQPALWDAIPALEELLTAWEEKCNSAKYMLYKLVLNFVLEKVKKYYSNTNIATYLVLHHYYKLMYIEMAWGGAEEQM